MQPRIAPLPLSSLARVRAPRAARKLAMVLGVFCLVLPVLLLFVPWLQNVPASGSVTAFDPLDRVQTIPVPVDGRLTTLNVAEGQFVEKGELLAEIVDQDANFAVRLQDQVDFANRSVRAIRDQLETYERQLDNERELLEHSRAAAQFDLRVAEDKVKAAKLERDGLQAALNQKRVNAQRQRELRAEGLNADIDVELAEADEAVAQAKYDAAVAKVSQEENNKESEQAEIERITSDIKADIEKTKSARDEAVGKLQDAESKLQDAESKLARQDNRAVYALRDGYIQRIHAAGSADLLSKGAPLIEIVPEADQLAVELFVRGIDAPLVSVGRKVRLQFEGYPAVQWAGWPSVAVGTFGGLVAQIDPQAGPDGRTRILVLPDPDDAPWPDGRAVRQNVRANAWVLLDQVSIGYEIWRQLNAFPPSVQRKSKEGEGPTIGGKRPVKSK